MRASLSPSMATLCPNWTARPTATRRAPSSCARGACSPLVRAGASGGYLSTIPKGPRGPTFAGDWRMELAGPEPATSRVRSTESSGGFRIARRRLAEESVARCSRRARVALAAFAAVGDTGAASAVVRARYDPTGFLALLVGESAHDGRVGWRQRRLQAFEVPGQAVQVGEGEIGPIVAH